MHGNISWSPTLWLLHAMVLGDFGCVALQNFPGMLHGRSLVMMGPHCIVHSLRRVYD